MRTPIVDTTTKILITGHTRVIGKAIFEWFELFPCDVAGASKSNGFDISKPDDRSRVVELARKSNIFVNNAFSDYDSSQNDVLSSLLETPGSLHTIINISSNTKKNGRYGLLKKELNDICNEYLGTVHLINLKPGYVDTHRVKNVNLPKMDVQEVVDIMEFCLSHKLKISEIEFSCR